LEIFNLGSDYEIQKWSPILPPFPLDLACNNDISNCNYLVMPVSEKVESFLYLELDIFVYENLRTSTVISALLILIPKYLSLCVEAVRGHANQGGSGYMKT
jgi:hypothetical protein